MTSSKKSIADRLSSAQLAISNAFSDEELKTMLAEFGYAETKLNEGKALLDNADTLQTKQQKEYGDQYQATDTLNEAWDRANKEYVKFVKIARIALKSDRAQYVELGLPGNRKRTISGWISQAKQFYQNALDDAIVLEKLATYGITVEKLNAGRVLFDQVETAFVNQKKEMGEAQQATIDRDQALDNLDSWMSDFISIARIALEEKPQYLEKLGVIV